MRDRILANAETIYQHPELVAKKTDWDRDRLKGKIKHLSIESARYYEDSGEYISKTPALISSYSYNPQGMKTEEFLYNPDGSLSYKGIFLYDSDGKLIESTEDNVDIVFSKCIFQYDENGLPKDSFEYDSEGVLLSRWVHYYNEQGRIQESFRYRDPSILWRWLLYSYSKDNYQIEETNYSPESVMTYREIGTYDLKGRLIHKARHISGSSSQQIEHYLYDNKGNMVEEINEYTDGLRDTRIYTYDDNGNKTESTWYQNNGTLMIKLNFHYKYNAQGNWTEMSVYESIGKDTYTKKFPMEIQYRKLSYY